VTGGETLGVTAVGVLVGLDLVSVPQAMTARPLVAAFVGGWLMGHPAVGLLVGALLELFALETLPVGAARYPDWGPPAVAAGALVAEGAGTPVAAGIWPGLLAAVLVAALVASIGTWSMHLVRHANGAAIRRSAERLERGDPKALIALQAGGFVRDSGRSAALTLLALWPGGVVIRVLSEWWRAPSGVAEAVVLAVAFGAAACSAWRLFGRGVMARWLVAGLAVGCVGVLLWA
jgi:mannose/fructose/N-acetylgalactosamine-specific phosphotransferase system component IIC